MKFKILIIDFSYLHNYYAYVIFIIFLYYYYILIYNKFYFIYIIETRTKATQ